MKIRIFLLILANLTAALILFYFLDQYNISSIYSDVKNQLFEKTVSPENARFQDEDPYLLEKMEQKKLMESFDRREADLKKLSEALKEKEKEILKEKIKISEAQKELRDQKELLKKQQEQKEAYSKKVKKLAEQYSGMPPEKSVAIITQLGDDLLILDVLEQMDKLAEEQGGASIVPYLYTLMPPDTASRLQRKSTISK